MDELEKCMAGEYYNCHEKTFLDFKSHAAELLKVYNAFAYEQKEEKKAVLKELFGEIGENVSVGTPFICDYGRNIHIGNNVSINMNCTFIDCNKITIGDNVLIAPNVQLYTATHPVELGERYVVRQNSEKKEFIRGTYGTADHNRKRLLVRWWCYCCSRCNHRCWGCYRGRKCCHKRYTGKCVGGRKSMSCTSKN